MVYATMRYFNNSENAKQSDRDWIAGAIKIIIELHEQSKPKPEPVAGCRIENSKVVAIDFDGVTENCPSPLYTTNPPPKKPLNHLEIRILWLKAKNYTEFAGLIEQAHEIGTSHEPT